MEENRLYRILNLLLKSWAGTTKPKEREELNTLRKNPSWNQTIMDLESDRFILQEFKELGKYDSMDNFSIFINKVKEKEKSIKRKRWLRIGYAASLLFFIAATLFLIRGRQTIHPSTQIAALQEERNSIRLLLPNDLSFVLNHSSFNALDSMGIHVKGGPNKIDYSQVETDSNKLEEVEYHTLFIPHGNTFSVVLSDGSRVTLNSCSKLRYPHVFEKHKRDVYIDGEAYFEVTPNQEAPFRVHGQHFTVEVLGTEFNVSDYDDNFHSSITLIEGSIMLDVDNNNMILDPGEQIKVTHDKQIERKKRVNTDYITAWRENKIGFKDEKLEMIMKKIGRAYNVMVVYESPAIRERIFTGKVPSEISLPEFLEYLNDLTNVKFALRDNVIFVSEE